MKYILLSCLTILFFSTSAIANKKKKSTPKKAPITAIVNDSEIHWLTLNEAEEAMKKTPKKVWIDVYTGWCGWCKRMDKTTFANKNVIKYMNEKFYAIKLDAEQKSDINFMGKNYKFSEQNRANQFAVEILQGQMSYPTGVFMEEDFKTPQIIPGYQDVRTMEILLKYLGENQYKTIAFPKFQETFKGNWTD